MPSLGRLSGKKNHGTWDIKKPEYRKLSGKKPWNIEHKKLT